VAAGDDGWEDVKDGDGDGGDGDGDGDGDEGEWEDVPDDALDIEGGTAPDTMQLSKTLSAMAVERNQRAHIEESGELKLPSGRTAGHRSLRRYYKQKFGNQDNRDSVVIQKMVSEYKAIGLAGYGSGAANPEERRIRDRAQERDKNAHMRLGMRHNKSALTKHFREQTPYAG
jgi:hypothetical protein